MKHTPTPWKCRDANGRFLAGQSDWSASNDEIPSHTSVPVLAGDTTVALVVVEGWSEKKLEANADFIVRACNAHEDLIGMVKLLRDRLNKIPPANMLSNEKLQGMLDELFAKAEGRQ